MFRRGAPGGAPVARHASGHLATGRQTVDWYISVLKQYAVFSGRSRRKEYWFFALFNLIISIVLGIVDGIFGLSVGEGFGLLGLLYMLAVLLPAIGVSIRRLHDTGRSGWWLLLAFVPIIGAIVLLIFFVLDSQPEPNEYGANPKALAA
jgi:uncharacterized membrane protein YhaH (DUF805 family)